MRGRTSQSAMARRERAGNGPKGEGREWPESTQAGSSTPPLRQIQKRPLAVVALFCSVAGLKRGDMLGSSLSLTLARSARASHSAVPARIHRKVAQNSPQPHNNPQATTLGGYSTCGFCADAALACPLPQRLRCLSQQGNRPGCLLAPCPCSNVPRDHPRPSRRMRAVRSRRICRTQAGSSTPPLRQIQKRPLAVVALFCSVAGLKRGDMLGSSLSLTLARSARASHSAAQIRSRRICRTQAGSSTPPLRQLRKRPLAGPFSYLAERGGFEPPRGYKPLPDFESGTFNRSATSPESGPRMIRGHCWADKKRVIAAGCLRVG